ncbi:MAG: antitoxin VapB family protein [Betaproteobacteria bacterium]
MVKTITIRDEIYRKLIRAKRKDESFSELFDRLTECQDSRQILVKLRGSVDFAPGEKEHILSDITTKRAEHRV